ncbi:hypothetical protein HPP92_010943 [Vanilla planifolia]|uniref:Myb/SANT-like DNA-binding domain-containing protein n=1 Tax=Vanilla planifolia TaxID=51239 RepID=A0A835V1B6_VANPL|nr:hypothetical protein HPP92_010943 [Vanilla planifolia]
MDDCSPVNSLANTPTRSPDRSPISAASDSRCYWSDDATSTLVDKWGSLHKQKKLTRNKWEKIAKVVNSRSGHSKSHKTALQCQCHISKLKTRYNREKSMATSSQSTWLYFERLHNFLQSSPDSSPPLASALRKRRREFPPEVTSRTRNQEEEAMSELFRGMEMFTNAYKAAEESKLKLFKDMEKERMDHCRKIEEQRMDFVMNLLNVFFKLDGGDQGNP